MIGPNSLFGTVNTFHRSRHGRDRPALAKSEIGISLGQLDRAAAVIIAMTIWS